MAKKEWDNKQLEERGVLLSQSTECMTEREKDIFNLKWLKTTISYQSLLYRTGCYSSLQRTINLMERESLE